MLLLAATSPGLARAAAPDGANPLEGLTFYNDHESAAWLQWDAYRRTGQTSKADLIWRIAREPRAVWVGAFTRPNFTFKIRRIIDGAKAQGAVPILTVLRAEATSCAPGHRRCSPAHTRLPPRAERSRSAPRPEPWLRR